MHNNSYLKAYVKCLYILGPVNELCGYFAVELWAGRPYILE